MAPLQKKAPRRRGGAIAIRSDGVISTDVSSASGLLDGSLDDQKVSSNPYDNVSPLEIPQMFSPAANGPPTSSSPNTSPTPTSALISTDTRTLLGLLGDALSLTSAQSTDSLSTPVSTAFNQDLTSSVVSSSPAYTTIVLLTTSTATNVVDTITLSYFNGQDTQTSTPGSNAPSSTPDGTSLIRDDLSATPTFSNNPVILTSEAPLAVTTDQALVPLTSGTPITTTSTPTLTESVAPDLAAASPTSFFLTNVEATSFSFTQVSGSTITIPVTQTTQTIRPSVVPVSSDSPKRSVPVAAIAASTSTVIVLIVLVFGFLWVRRRQRTRGVFRTPFSFSQALETREDTLQATGAWNDPFAAFGPVVLAQDPFEDQVSMFDRPPNASRLSGGLSRSPVILRIPVLDPFADPRVFGSSKGNELPSRLSNASSYESHGPGASTKSNRIGFAM